MAANSIKKATTKIGTVVWVVDGRRFGAVPARPQFPTREQAEDALSEMIAKRGAGLNPTRRDVTFATQAESYLKHNASELAGRSLRCYQSVLRKHLIPKFGARRVVDITTAQIKDFLADKQVSGLKRNSVRLIRATLSMVFQSAVDDQLVGANPVAAAKTARHSRVARAAAKSAVAKDRPFNSGQQAAILRWCRECDQDLYDFVLIALRTGARPGEIRALRWQDVKADKIQIERSADDRSEVTLTKTGGTRLIDMTPALGAALAERKLRQAPESDASCVFGNGTPPNSHEFARRFEACLKECGITGHTLYDCRHTFASVLLTRGANLKYVSTMLGHSDSVTTLRYYDHYLRPESERFVDLLDNAASKIGAMPPRASAAR